MPTPSSKCSNFLPFLFSYLNVFLIAPRYDFTNERFHETILTKIQGCCLIFTSLILTAAAIITESVENFFGMLIPSEKILYILTSTTLLALTLTTITKSAFLDVKNWKTLLTNYQYIDKKVATRESHLYYKFVLKQIMFLVAVIYLSYGWSLSLNMPPVKVLLISPFVELYYEYLLITLLTTFVDKIRSGYSHLNASLIKWSHDPKFINEMRTLSQDYRRLGHTIDVFNDLFGYQMILIIFHCGAHAVSSLNFTINSGGANLTDSVFFNTVCPNFCLFCFAFVSILNGLKVIIAVFFRSIFPQLL